MCIAWSAWIIYELLKSIYYILEMLYIKSIIRQPYQNIVELVHAKIF